MKLLKVYLVLILLFGGLSTSFLFLSIAESIELREFVNTKVLLGMSVIFFIAFIYSYIKILVEIDRLESTLLIGDKDGN